MASSLYDISVTSFLQILDALGTVLDKGAAHCADNGIDPDSLLAQRIAEDMLPLSFQLHMATVHTTGSLDAIRAGETEPSGGIPELSYTGFRERLAESAASLRELGEDDVNGLAGQRLVFRVGGVSHFPGTTVNARLVTTLRQCTWSVTSRVGIGNGHQRYDECR